MERVTPEGVGPDLWAPAVRVWSSPTVCMEINKWEEATVEELARIVAEDFAEEFPGATATELLAVLGSTQAAKRAMEERLLVNRAMAIAAVIELTRRGFSARQLAGALDISTQAFYQRFGHDVKRAQQAASGVIDVGKGGSRETA